MQHPPSTVERAFELASDVEKQLQVADSFKLDFPTYPSREPNEISMEETSGYKQEINKMSKGKKWGNNTNNYTKSTQILVTVAAPVTNISSTDLKKIGKPNSGHNGQKTPKSH